MISLFFSKNGIIHIGHLRQVFDRCREFGISLNPAKSVFGVTEGKLLGHIISRDGIKIDPEELRQSKRFLSLIILNPFSLF